MQNKIFIFSDAHFCHFNIIAYEGRPDNFNELIVENWNSVVKPTDTVINLGDFNFGSSLITKRYKDQLNGEQILVRGNHERFRDDVYLDIGFLSVRKQLEFNWGNDKILFTHRPFRPELLTNYTYNIHGHLHSNGHRLMENNFLTNKHLLFSPESNGGSNLFPVELTEFIIMRGHNK